MAAAGGGAHVLVFPYPAQGHMLCLLDLTHHLAVRGLSITILITPKNLPILTPLLSAHPTAVQTLILPLPPHPALPPGVENTKDLPVPGFSLMITALAGLHTPIVDWFNHHPSPPTAIISDLFLGWTQTLAAQLGIPRYVFSPTGALGLAVMNSLWRNLPKRDDPSNDNVLVSFPEIPNSPTFPWWQLSPIYRSYVEGDPVIEFMKDGINANSASYGVIINSFTELDGVYIDHVKSQLGHDRVFAVGPILPPAHNSGTQRGGSSSGDVLSWLDKCADGTVVYVGFGSQTLLTDEQMAAIGLGLEMSGVKFVWLVKEPTAGHVEGAVPEGFEDRVGDRGFVVRGWAPQVAILGHEAVGASLTHCGWNSVMETLMAGVLVLTWPMSADNFSNAKLLQEIGLGVKACEGIGAVPDSGELARLLKESVGEARRSERERAGEFAKVAKRAMEVGGSSWKDVNKLSVNLS